MANFKKFLFLWLILSGTLLFADSTRITVTDAATVHENSGSMRFTIQLSDAPWFSEVKVRYYTSNGSAKAGEDYTSTSGTATFTWWTTTQTITVPITDDNIHESTENLYLYISNDQDGYTVTRNRGRGEIADNDKENLPLELTLHNRLENEGDSNWVLNFTARLNQDAPRDIQVNYTTQDSSAIAGSDYIASSGTITISAGSRDGYIPITVIGDLDPEENREQFKVKITSISEGEIVRDTATGTIYDDDAIQVDISSQDVNEGDSGDRNKMPFKIFLKKAYPSDTPLSIDYQTEDGSNPSATTADSDYITTSGSVTFHKGEREKMVYVTIIGDETIEHDENVRMRISGSDYIIDHSSESEIINDDGDYPSVDFSTGDFSIEEGNSSTKQLIFNFTLDKPALADSSFDYYTADDDAKVSDNDYQAITTTTYTIPEGSKTISIPVTINGDTKIENDETFYLKFTNEKNIVIHGHTAKGDILNDDGSYPELTFDHNSYDITEGDEGEKTLNFTLTLDNDAIAGSSFSYKTLDSTAKSSDNDYVAVHTTTYTFKGGERTIKLPVTIKGDKNIEDDEAFYIRVRNPNGLKIRDNEILSKGRIINDDGEFPRVSISAEKKTYQEGDSNQTKVDFVIKLDKPSTDDEVSVEYYTTDRTASYKDSDYQQITTTKLFFKKGEQEKHLSVYIIGDEKVEEDEYFAIWLNHPHHAKMGSQYITIKILNDDQHSDEPFTCNSNMYISSSTNRGNGESGRMWLHKIDTNQDPFEFQVVDNEGATELYNALAYSEKDNYIYGLYHRELIRLTRTGKVINLGRIDALPTILDNKQLYAGASYNGFYYVTGPGVAYDKIFKINLSNKELKEIKLTKAVSIQDFSFSPKGKYLYGIADGGKLIKIEVATGKVTEIGSNHSDYQFDSTFSDKRGRFFANDSKGHGFFEFNLETGEKLFLSNSQPATLNDGANCIKAALVFNDFGDAPKSYGKARHRIANGIYLGDKVDHDIHNFYGEDANGDDNNGIDDEDGVTLVDGSDLNGSYFELEKRHKLKVKLSKRAYLRVWIDKGIDGKFDSNDLVYDNQLNAGEQTIEFTLPANLKKRTTTYLRARVSSTPNMDPKKFLRDGEAEDYAIKFGSAIQPLRGTFNIERTNSGSSPINSSERNAWYTQIVGRDFDYSVLFYEEDMSAQKEIDNVTVKLELINQESNQTLYTRYAHIKNDPPKSRIDVTLPTNDLASLPATKKAIFRISYGVDDNGNIIQSSCSTDPKRCYEAQRKIKTEYARDNFAIRPESFYMVLKDHNQTLKINRDPSNKNSNRERLATGYDYNLTIIATQQGKDPISNPAWDYNTTIDRILRFVKPATATCQDDANVTTPVVFKDGVNQVKLFEHFNTGSYDLHLVDSNWSRVDWDKKTPDCKLDDASISRSGNQLSGCNIESKPDLYLRLYPFKFAMNFMLNNLPDANHDDFIYMSEINATNAEIALQFIGTITAQSADDINNTNFTVGCMAEDLRLRIDATTLSDNGIDQPLQTSLSPNRARSDLFWSRVIRYNNDADPSHSDLNQTVIQISDPIDIDAKHFLDDQNGTTTIDLRYNLNKNLSETINPIRVTLHAIDSNATNAFSEANMSSPYYPIGHQNLGDSIRNFYFTQVAPDQTNYKRVYFNKSPSIRTPLSIDVFCDANGTLRDDTNITAHTNIANSPRQQDGWFLLIDHNTTIDGGVVGLTPTPPIVTLSHNPTQVTPIEFLGGRFGLLVNRFDLCTSAQNQSTVVITPNRALRYHPNPANNGLPRYQISCTTDSASQWTGVGQTGKIINANPNVIETQKIDW